ncbi:MAG: hypothetical protein L3J35_01620 [Bacteroidales bacterium]|nr:hypothetical protein [Bacteroidales bacterium]
MFVKQLFDNYELYKEKSLAHRRIKHKDILPLVLKRSSVFKVQEVGKSFEGREIFVLKTGTGKTKVMLWSQMHGNEPTATQTLFDIFNLFEKPKSLQTEINEILKACTLYFIPMLNPDGAEQFKRRNAQDIDINRDALRLAAPESNILMNLRDKLNADFGFNLHDQDIWYSAGNTKNPATLSFLAPTFNTAKDIDEKRKKSMQLIVSINNMLQEFIPGQTAKYDDTFMPTAFGDNIQKRGTSTILIESGGYKNDVEKQFVRKLNFISILHALKQIANKSFHKERVSLYDKIPFNKKNKLFDFILRNTTISGKFGEYNADIGIRSRSLIEKDIFTVDDIGDLSQNNAFYEVDLKKKKIQQIKIGANAQKLIGAFFTK